MSPHEDEKPSAEHPGPGESQPEVVIPLHAEELVVSRRKVDSARVRVATVTREVEKLVQEEFVREHAEIERTVIGRIVDAVPPVREEGDVTVIPVVEEVIVVQRKILLKEEIRVRRARTAEQHVETVVLRQQEIEITRTPLSGQNSPQAAGPDKPVAAGRDEE